MPARTFALLGAALLLAGCGEQRPPAPVVTLAPSADTVQTDLSDITFSDLDVKVNRAELRDGKAVRDLKFSNVLINGQPFPPPSP